MNEMEKELRALVARYGFREIQAKMDQWASMGMGQTWHVAEEMQRRMKAEDELVSNLATRFAPGYCSLGRIDGLVLEGKDE